MAAAYLQPVSRRRRAISLALTLAIHALLVLLFVRLAPREYVPFAGRDALTTFDVAPEARAERRAAARPPAAAAAPRPVTPPQPRAPTPPPPPVVFKDTSGVIWMSREQFAATTLRQSPARGAGRSGTADGDAAGDGGPPVVGRGPNGQPMYAAEWVREPTNAELRTYLPPTEPGSWGTIACRTIPRNRVDDCEIVDESPGSRLATGVRRAAWQFQVRPPRRGGEPMIGVWVRIRIEITARGAGAG